MNESTIEIGRVPAAPEDLLALRDRVAATPEGGAAVFVAALLAYGQDPALGLRCLTIAVEARQLVAGDRGYKGKQLALQATRDFADRLGGKPWVARSYVVGTAPASGYALPAGPLAVRLRIQPRDVGPEQTKVFVHSSGADTPRPLTLVRNDRGLWKAKEWSSLQVGVRPPAAGDGDDI